MPRIPVDYTKTIIYKIAKYGETDLLNIYIGHTTDFTTRKSDHKRCCNNPNSKKYNFKVYKYIRDNGGWDNFNMLEIMKYPCTDGNEARAKEEQIRVELGAKLNSNRALITGDKKEYQKEKYNDNKEKNKEKHKEQKEQKEQQKEDKRILKEQQKEQRKEQRKQRGITKLLKEYEEYEKYIISFNSYNP
jgi:hypothetical protein